MEKVSSIKKMQMFTLLFLVSVVLDVIVNLIKWFAGITLPGVISWPISIFSLVTYILLWISYSTSKRYQLKTNKKYLLLAIVVLVVTLLTIGSSLVFSWLLTSSALEQGIITLTMDVETMNAVLMTQPEYKIMEVAFFGIALIVDIIYLGLGYTIFTQNKVALSEAEQEYKETYGQ